MIFGVALLAACMFIGSFVGNVLGALIGLDSDVGGVGFAMLLLLLVVNSKKISQKLPKGSAEGLTFWKEMFLPIVIAMSTSQNVYHAVSGGAVAAVAGLASVAASFALLVLLRRISKKKSISNDGEETL